jgi:hypothetical protein
LGPVVKQRHDLVELDLSTGGSTRRGAGNPRKQRAAISPAWIDVGKYGTLVCVPTAGEELEEYAFADARST